MFDPKQIADDLLDQFRGSLHFDRLTRGLYATDASLVAFGVRRSWMVCVTPFLNSCRPVSRAERVSEQVGLT